MAATVACGLRWGDVVLLPTDFEGWVMIHYDVPGGAPLERAGLKTLIRVPPSGVVFTSSGRAEGYGSDEYFFVSSEGKRTPVRSEAAEGCEEQQVCVQRFQFFSPPAQATLFFVGKRGNLSLYRKPKLQ